MVARSRGARTNITTFTIPRSLDGGEKYCQVMVYYVKLQDWQVMSQDLRRFAIADAKFRQCSTMKQFYAAGARQSHQQRKRLRAPAAPTGLRLKAHRRRFPIRISGEHVRRDGIVA